MVTFRSLRQPMVKTKISKRENLDSGLVAFRLRIMVLCDVSCGNLCPSSSLEPSERAGPLVILPPSLPTYKVSIHRSLRPVLQGGWTGDGHRMDPERPSIEVSPWCADFPWCAALLLFFSLFPWHITCTYVVRRSSCTSCPPWPPILVGLGLGVGLGL